jgi:hypothetical protein
VSERLLQAMDLRRGYLKRVRRKMRSWKQVGLVLFMAIVVCSIFSTPIAVEPRSSAGSKVKDRRNPKRTKPKKKKLNVGMLLLIAIFVLSLFASLPFAASINTQTTRM